MQRDTGDPRWWTILYVSKDVDKNEEGSYIWKLRDELESALRQVDLCEIYFYANSDDDGMDVFRCWWLTAKPKIWSFSDAPIGEVKPYSLCNENGNKCRIFRNFLDAKTGNMVIGYEATPVL